MEGGIKCIPVGNKCFNKQNISCE